MYASGNIILTDHEYTILSLLRIHKFEDDAAIAVKQKYPFSHAANLTIDSINLEPEKIKELMTQPAGDDDAQKKQKKSKSEKQGVTLKAVLSKMVPYCSNPYAEHAIRLVGGDPSAKADPLQMGQVQTLVEAAEKIRDIVKGMESLDEIRGFLLYKENTAKKHLNEADE